MKNFDSDFSSNFRRSKRNVLIATIIFSILSGVISFWFENNPQIEQVFSLLTAIGYGILILIWCKIDSNERNENLGSGFRILLVIFGVFALIYYLFKSRGIKNGFISSGYALLFFIILILVSASASTGLYLLFGG